MTERIPLNKCINKEMKYWGLKAIGLLCGVIVAILLLIKCDLTVALIGSVFGYFIGDLISPFWAKGRIQRWIYGNLPTHFLLPSKYLVPSNVRQFIS